MRADGSIACGAHSGSIHKVGAALQGAPSCNGWTFWHVDEGGALLDLRIDALRATASLAALIARRVCARSLRPTAFVDSPFGHDGKVARLAGGMNWFSAVELIRVEGIEARLDRAGTGRGHRGPLRRRHGRAMAGADRAAAAAAARRAHHPPRPAAGHGHRQCYARQLLRRRAVRRRSRPPPSAGADMAARGRGDHRRRRRIRRVPAPSRCGKATRSSGSCPSSASSRRAARRFPPTRARLTS